MWLRSITTKQHEDHDQVVWATLIESSTIPREQRLRWQTIDLEEVCWESSLTHVKTCLWRKARCLKKCVWTHIILINVSYLVTQRTIMWFLVSCQRTQMDTLVCIMVCQMWICMGTSSWDTWCSSFKREAYCMHNDLMIQNEGSFLKRVGCTSKVRNALGVNVILSHNKMAILKQMKKNLKIRIRMCLKIER